jgi:hypothetical protein
LPLVSRQKRRLAAPREQRLHLGDLRVDAVPHGQLALARERSEVALDERGETLLPVGKVAALLRHGGSVTTLRHRYRRASEPPPDDVICPSHEGLLGRAAVAVGELWGDNISPVAVQTYAFARKFQAGTATIALNQGAQVILAVDGGVTISASDMDSISGSFSAAFLLPDGGSYSASASFTVPACSF